jgi:glycosyltransferase involved in cell wall biosynthesis
VRIAFDYQAFCLRSHGGVARYFVRIAEQLIAAQQDVGFFAPLHQNHFARGLPPGVVHGYALNRYPPRCGRLILPLNHLFSKLAIHRWRPQVVHETYYSRRRLAPKSCPSVVTVYDMIHELFPKDLTSRDNTTKLKRLAVDRADHVICISESTRRDLIEIFGTRDSKVSVVHLGVDRFLCAGEPSEKLLAKTTPYLLYVGSRWGYKNYSGFVRAVASSARLKTDFDILAFGGGTFSASEIALLAELGFRAGQVRQVSGDDVLLGHYYSRAAGLVYPSLYEGFGLPPLEAMANGCAVICSNTSSLPEVVGEAAELFDPKSSDDMVAAIERVVYSPSRTRNLLERGRQRLAAFSWNRCANRTLDIYRSLAGL